MASISKYKRLENNAVGQTKKTVIVMGKGIAKASSAVWRFLTYRYTVVFVPHSEKRVYNLHINVLSVICFLLVAGSVLGAFLWYGASYNSSKVIIAGKDSSLKNVQASLDELRDETSVLLREARGFETALSNTLSALGTNTVPQRNQVSGGDLGSFFNIRETSESSLREVDDVRQLSSYLTSVSPHIQEIGSILNSKIGLFTEIPSVWPIKDGIGHVSMYFGPNINPFSGMYYIHKGIDISTYRMGDPIIATADGQVVTSEYHNEFGYYVIVRHKHGYYTRYAHMTPTSVVSLGQRVQQGDVIGFIGNSGRSTGAHLHYEIHIGSDVVDPYNYMNIRASNRRQGRGR